MHDFVKMPEIRYFCEVVNMQWIMSISVLSEGKASIHNLYSTSSVLYEDL